MNWIIPAFTLFLTVLLFFQGTSCLRRPGAPSHVRWFGGLAVVLVALSVVLHILLFSNRLVLSSEFGIAMVEGSWAWFGLSLLIMGLAIAGAMGANVARSGAGSPNRLPWLLSIGLIVGLLAASRLRPLNPDDWAPLRIYAYDLWWPLLLIWLSACLITSGLVIVPIRRRSRQLWAAGVAIAGLALGALSEPQLADPTSQPLWQVTLLVVLPVSMGLATWLALTSLGQRLDRFGWLTRFVLILGPATVGLLSGLLWLWGIPLPLMVTPWFLFVGWPVLMGLVVIGYSYRAWRASTAGWQSLPKPTVRQCFLLLGLVSIAASLGTPIYFVSIDPIFALIGFILAWILLAELTAAGPLSALCQRLFKEEVRAVGSPLQPAWTVVRTGLIHVGNRLRDLASASSVPIALMKMLIAIVILIAMSEVPNVGRTVIQPFSAPADLGKDLGHSISDRLLNALGLLHEELRPDVIRLRPRGGGVGLRFQVVSASGSAGGVDAALAKSGDLEFWGVKIPVSLFVAPIRVPMRTILVVRVIDGNLQAEKRGDEHRYALLASSSAGETWRTEAVTSTSTVPVAMLADELAFKVLVSSDSALGVAGMTRSWEAFELFRIGLVHWRRFEAERDYDALPEAIKHFQQAALKDPTFALAHYRLGVVLQLDGQPGKAAEAFRASLRADPNFMAGYAALASTLYDFERYYYPAPAAVPLEPPPGPSVNQARANEARHLWQQLLRVPTHAVSLPDRASAYYGLCRYVHDNASDEPGESYLAYFYCKRAEGLYAQFPTARRADPLVRESEGAVLRALGLILEKSRQVHFTIDTDDWHCSVYTIKADSLTPDGRIRKRELWISPYSRTALRYYDRAFALLPKNQVIRCDAASTAYALGNAKPMRILKLDAAAHVALADNYSHWARTNPSYYRLALAEYERAIEVDPTAIDALNNYGYTFWQWRYHGADAGFPEMPDSDMAPRAERYARYAITLATGKLASTEEGRLRSTLAEVLLAQARPHEAIEEFEKALARVPKHVYDDEVRWDLAQAYLCASFNDQRGGLPVGHVQALRKKVFALLEEIRRKEGTREARSYTRQPKLLDPNRSQLVCRRESQYAIDARPGPAGPLYVLRTGRPRYERSTSCNWLGVVGNAHNLPGARVSDLWLRVWGGGVDDWVSMGEHGPSGERDSVFLSSVPRDTYQYYFAQLYNENGMPVSEVYPLQTFGNKIDGQCSKNLIILTFDQQR